jgi:hypothetical protein
MGSWRLLRIIPDKGGIRREMGQVRSDLATITRGKHIMVTVLWLIAVVLVIAGIVTLVRGQMLMGIVLIVVGLLVGPGGVSIFNR